jgi:hypothetical protein
MSVLLLCERALGLLNASDLRDLEDEHRVMLENLNFTSLLNTHAQREAVICARHFESVRDSLFNTYPWVFARRNAALTLAGGSVAGWRFVYSLPAGCAKIHELVQKYGTTPKYEQNGNQIACNASNVSAKYSVIVEDTTQWPMLFQDAFCSRLAQEICLAVGKPPALGAQAFQIFQFSIAEGYRTGIIDPGTKLDMQMNKATHNTQRLYNPSPEPEAPRRQ